MENTILTPEQEYELGFEIIAGLHAEKSDNDMEWGRLEAAEDLTEDPDCPEEYREGMLKHVEWSNKRMNKQAHFLAKVVIEKLIQMQILKVPE